MRSKRSITVIVTSCSRVPARYLKFSQQHIAAAGLAVFGLVGLLAFFGLHYYQMWVVAADYQDLRQEVTQLRKSDQAFRLAAKQLSERLSALQLTAQKLKIVSGFDTDGLGGVGGPSTDQNPVLKFTEKGLLQHFRTLDRKRINLESEFQKLQDYYTTREILISATPSILPARGYPSAGFGYRSDPFTGLKEFHSGIDVSAPTGAKVLATADGIVSFAGRRPAYGKLVTVNHKFGIATRYGHLDRYTVQPGQRVRKGDIIGYIGSTGRSTGPHVHYEVRLGGRALNPLRFLHDSE